MGKQLNSYTAGYKLKVIEFALEHGKRAAGRKFDVDEKCVRRWCAQKKALQNTNIKKRAFRGKQCKYPDLEEELLRYVTEVRNDGFALTTDMLRMKALALARAKNIPAGDFKASAGWVRRFLKKKGLSFGEGPRCANGCQKTILKRCLVFTSMSSACAISTIICCRK